jgi:hypothetical protein
VGKCTPKWRSKLSLQFEEYELIFSEDSKINLKQIFVSNLIEDNEAKKGKVN